MKHLPRREFLKRALCCAAGVGAWGAFPGLGVSSAHALRGNGRKLLLINMNGGWDGLSVCQPRTGAAFTTLRGLRPTLALPSEALLDLDGRFGLHPRLPTMQSLYAAGDLATVFPVGYHHMSRSHEEAEVAYARGVSDRLSANASGFINRLGSTYRWNGLQAVSVAGTDRAFQGGEYRGIQVSGLADFRFVGANGQSTAENNHRRDTIYGLAGLPAAPTMQDINGSYDALLNSVDAVRDALSSATFATPYPNSLFGRQFRDIDVLFSTPAFGTELGYMRRVGFDTHSEQAPALDRMLGEFDQALAAFVTNMKAKGLWSSLAVLIISEFGRTNVENGSGGTDHGGAVPIFALGGAVSGGIFGEITQSDLTAEGWLPMRYHIVDVYRQATAALGYDPDRIFERPAAATLPALFS